MTLTVSGEGRERLGRARELEVVGAGSSREGGRLASGGHGRGHDGGAVDEVVRVVAEDGELRHRSLEGLSHEFLLVDKALPEASSARVVGEAKVGLETEFANIGAVGDRERRGHLAGVVVQSGEANALEQDLKEDLSVEGEGRLQAKSKLLNSSNEG